MKKFLFVITCLCVLALTATTARADIALLQGDSQYLGFVQGVNPELANESDQAAMINTLRTLAIGALVQKSPPAGFTWYDRRASTLTGPFPVADATGVHNIDGSNTGIVVVGSAYIVGKYDGPNVGDHIWYVSAGTYSIPDKLGDPVDGSKPLGLSHYAVYGTSVPDGGMTVMLLGGALLGLRSLRRRFRV